MSSITDTIRSYAAPPIAAAAAIVPSFRHLPAKSCLQKGLPISSLTMWEGMQAGFKAAPTVGCIVGAQMLLQTSLEQAVGNQKNFASTLAAAGVVGALSSPCLAIFNGQTMGWGLRESLRKFSTKQGAAIAAQETVFVIGLSAADFVAAPMKKIFGDNKVVDYTAAFMSGAAGSLAGHPANTALTRWQCGMSVEPHQLMWGAARKARAIGLFATWYTFGKEILQP